MKTFNFDFVGAEDLSQQTLFEEIAQPITLGCLEGYNGTIFAYGQTGSGKTYTI
jgi:kinesin family protein 6/9